jgi:N-acetylglucosaminyldiphosphoundecaprenol N-acetyl-beta-D-mannosaminyltransferase
MFKRSDIAMSDCESTTTLTLERPTTVDVPKAAQSTDRFISILGVRITDVTRRRAVALLEDMIDNYNGRARSVFFANAHTLNLAAADHDYRRVLNSADCVFGDGTGVRWAARLQNIRVRDNLLGTELTPELFQATAGRGYRYFLLGAGEESIRRAAQFTRHNFPGWIQAGYHHGYVHEGDISASVVRQINAARPHVLLVGMGNPLQERWIHAHRRLLRVPVCMAVGGLFNYWSGELRRSPLWLRRIGSEWLGILFQQPRKMRRYLLGNPLFLWRIFRLHH